MGMGVYLQGQLINTGSDPLVPSNIGLNVFISGDVLKDVYAYSLVGMVNCYRSLCVDSGSVKI